MAAALGPAARGTIAPEAAVDVRKERKGRAPYQTDGSRRLVIRSNTGVDRMHKSYSRAPTGDVDFDGETVWIAGRHPVLRAGEKDSCCGAYV